MSTNQEWFTVDRKGLAKLLARKGKAFIVYELLQNAWDSAATKVEVTIEPVKGRPNVRVVVSDDAPDGFHRLTDSWTLFAESEKKGDPEKRGRFNLGEKLVFAVAESAVITTTKGTVRFNREGRHVSRRMRTTGGSTVSVVLRATREEMREMIDSARRVLPPKPTTVNGERLPTPVRTHSTIVTLPTVIADAEGVLRPRERQTTIDIIEATVPMFGGTSRWLYEMGIPVCETGDRWSYNVTQKIPLNFERDTVTESYLRRIRVAVLNAMHEKLVKEDVISPWVRDAAADSACLPEATRTIFRLRFGNKAVAVDPSDPEGTKMAMQQGYTVVPGGTLTAGEWQNARVAGVLKPAGQVTPSQPQAFEMAIPVTGWTVSMQETAEYLRRIAARLLGVGVTGGRRIGVSIINNPGVSTLASYSHGHLTLNLGRLGAAWFGEPGSNAQIEILLHELAHDRVSDHLSKDFNDEVCRLAAKLVRLALEEPEVVRP